MSKELITIYNCDRCGKQMKSQYAILTLKRTNKDSCPNEIIDWDICEDCFKKIDLVVRDKKAMIVTSKDFGNWITTKSYDNPAYTKVEWTGIDPLSRQSGTWKTEPLNKHLNVMSV